MPKSATNEKPATAVKRVPKKLYEAELERLQVELVEMQQWVIASGARVRVIAARNMSLQVQAAD